MSTLVFLIVLEERCDFHLPIDDRDGVPRRKRFDGFATESDIQQRDAFAGRGEQIILNRVAHRFDAQRIPRDQHLTLGIHIGQRPSSIDTAGHAFD